MLWRQCVKGCLRGYKERRKTVQVNGDVLKGEKGNEEALKGKEVSSKSDKMRYHVADWHDRAMEKRQWKYVNGEEEVLNSVV